MFSKFYLQSSARSLHAMLGCVAILVMIAAAIEITFFFRISFCFLTTAVSCDKIHEVDFEGCLKVKSQVDYIAFY